MKKIACFLFAWLLQGYALSQETFIPEPSLKMVSDFENLLSDSEEEQIAYGLKQQYDASSNQLMIVTIPTRYLGGTTIEDYAQQLFEKWQPGQKGLDNGVILLVCGSKIDSIGRKLRIHTGYGLEGVLPDLLCSKIEREVIVPELKRGNYFKAIKNGAVSILNFTAAENKGKVPLYKIEVPKSNASVYDYARIFSDEEKETLEKSVHSIFNVHKLLIVTELDYSNYEDHVYLSQKYSSDTVVMYIAYNPGYYIDEKDSTLRFDETKKTYDIKYFAIDDEFDFNDYNNLYKSRDLLTESLHAKGIFNVTLGLAQTAQATYAAGIRKVIYCLGLFALLTLLVFGILLFVKKQKPVYKTTPLKITLGIILTLTSIYSWACLFSFELPFYLGLNITLGFPKWITVCACIFMAVLQILNIILVGKINTRYFQSKLFSWLGKGSGGSSYYNNRDSNNSSSDRTDNSSSSSSGGSNSASNSGYYGGGGKSGGGGASSDW